MVKNPSANTGDVGDMGSIPGSEDSLEECVATHFSTLAWRIPWTKEPGRLQSIWLQRVKLHFSDLTYTHTQNSLRIAILILPEVIISTEYIT